MPRLLHITTVPMSLLFIEGQVEYMKRLGFEVGVLSSPGEDLQAFGQRNGVASFEVRMQRQISPFRDLASIWRIVTCLRRYEPAIVHAHTPKGGLLGTAAAWFVGSPIRIYHMRGLPFVTAKGWRRMLLRWSETMACGLAHQVFCVSHSVRELAIAEGVCPAEKIKVLAAGSGNGVDAILRFNPVRLAWDTRSTIRTRYGIPDDAPVIGFVGRLVRDKGIEELAEAWQRLRRQWPDAHMLLVGPFEPRDPVPAGIEQKLRADSRVHLAGMQRNTPDYYAAMDLVAVPSYREGFPNVALEAAAMELPVVATRIPGCIDAVQDRVTGTLVPVHDPGSLAESMHAYLSDPHLRSQHGRAGRKRVMGEFSQQQIWDALAIEYSRLLQTEGIRVTPPAAVETTQEVLMS